MWFDVVRCGLLWFAVLAAAETAADSLPSSRH